MMNVADMEIGKTYLLDMDGELTHYTVLAKTKDGGYMLLYNVMNGEKEWVSISFLSSYYRVIDEVVSGGGGR